MENQCVTLEQKFADYAARIKEIRNKEDAAKKENLTYHYTEEEDAFITKVNTELYAQLEQYIWSFINANYKSYLNIFEDLRSICILKMYEAFPGYNGQYSLTTYYVRFFKGACNDFLGKKVGLSSYYNEINNKVQKVVTAMEKKGISVSVSEIKRRLNDDNISEQTIERVLRMAESHTEQLNPDYIDSQEHSFQSPEEMLIEKEDKLFINDILSVLLPYERVAYKLYYGAYDAETGYFDKAHMTYKFIGMSPSFLKSLVDSNIGSFIKKDNDGKLFVPKEKVEGIIRTATKKVKAHPSVMKVVDAKRSVYGKEILSCDAEADASALADVLAAI